MKALSDWFYRVSSPLILITALLLFLVFSVTALPGQSKIVAAYSQGTGSPDTSFIYSGSRLYQMAGAYGEEGRAAYLRARWTFDLAFPFVYTFFLVTSISLLLNRILAPDSRWRLLNLVPLAAMALDLLENTAASLVMARYPLHCPIGEVLGPVFTPIKWFLVGLSFIILAWALIMAVIRMVQKQRIQS